MRYAAFTLILLFLLSFSVLPLTSTSSESSQLTLDEIFSDISYIIPGFSGLYIDEDGQLTILIVENASNRAIQQMAAGAMILSRLRMDVAEAISTGRYKIINAKFDFRSLWTWRMKILNDHRLYQLVSFIDIDERRNRLLIGLRESTYSAEVVRILTEAGIPEAGFSIVVSEIRPMTSLRDYVRPTVGGLQIAFSNYLCTLGFNAIRLGTRGYLTNSHCTTTQFQYDGTTHYQPTVSSNYAIGVEQVDPTYFTGTPCPPGYRCRYSDAAFGGYLSSVSSSLGKIAKTSGIGSITIIGEYTIVGEVSLPIVGETLNKVGRTTGWTQGVVTNTCVTTLVSGTNYALICQDFVRANAGPGDSGSPVFKIVDSSTGNVQLYGILWGGGEINGVTHFVFSNIANIEIELGDLTTFQPPATPQINVIYPNGGESLYINSTIQIRWNSQAVSGNVRILLSRDGGSTWSIIFSETLNDGSEPWLVTGPATNSALIRIESVTNSSIYDTSDSTFRIVRQPLQPIVVRVIKPNGDEILRRNSYYIISWRVSGGGEIIQTQIYFSPNAGTRWFLITTLSGNPGRYLWRVPNISTNAGLIKVVVTDNFGQIGEDTSDRTFRIR